MTFKLLSIQPCSVYQNGGCGRVLRRLFLGMEESVVCVAIHHNKQRFKNGSIDEINISLFPGQKKWMKWKLRKFNEILQTKVLSFLNKRILIKAVLKIKYDVLHVVNHGFFSAYFCEHQFISNKKLWVSFHDHYSLCSSYNDAKLLWQTANRRLVISKELGLKYSEEFGKQEFEIITDGLLDDEISSPKKTTNKLITIYFGGLLHYDYLPLFNILANALNAIVKKDRYNIKFVLRGSANIPFLNDQLFSVEYRNNFVPDEEIQKELGEADVLYLPIKFNKPEFYLYSMSTKMIGYLGAPGKIFYHGPAESAACNLLMQERAAICCTSLNEHDVTEALKALIRNEAISASAKIAARKRFKLSNIQSRFWNN